MFITSLALLISADYPATSRDALLTPRTYLTKIIPMVSMTWSMTYLGPVTIQPPHRISYNEQSRHTQSTTLPGKWSLGAGGEIPSN